MNEYVSWTQWLFYQFSSQKKNNKHNIWIGSKRKTVGSDPKQQQQQQQQWQLSHQLDDDDDYNNCVCVYREKKTRYVYADNQEKKAKLVVDWLADWPANSIVILIQFKFIIIK